MTEREPPRVRKLELRDSELSDLLDAAGRDVAPPEVLARSAQRLSAAIGFSLGDAGGLSAPPIESVAAATVKSAAAASAAKGATLTTALAAAAKPLLVVALASATSIAVWSAQPPREPSPRTIEPPRVAAPIAATPSLPATPTPAPIVTPLPVSVPDMPDVIDRQAKRSTRPPEPVIRAPESVARTIDTAPEELRSLQAAQAMLANRPADAAQALRVHAAKWPNGWLEEERAALLVEALSIAGQHDEAQRALEQLRARNPRSPALPRLARVLNDMHVAPNGLP